MHTAPIVNNKLLFGSVLTVVWSLDIPLAVAIAVVKDWSKIGQGMDVFKVADLYVCLLVLRKSLMAYKCHSRCFRKTSYKPSNK